MSSMLTLLTMPSHISARHVDMAQMICADIKTILMCTQELSLIFANIAMQPLQVWELWVDMSELFMREERENESLS